MYLMYLYDQNKVRMVTYLCKINGYEISTDFDNNDLLHIQIESVSINIKRRN
jgi:hypothetical protein